MDRRTDRSTAVSGRVDREVLRDPADGSDRAVRAAIWEEARGLTVRKADSTRAGPAAAGRAVRDPVVEMASLTAVRGLAVEETTVNQELELVRRARGKDVRAFSALVTLYQERAIHAAYSYIGNYEDARDIAQDAFIKAYDQNTPYLIKVK
jgi:hypothetical protein